MNLSEEAQTNASSMSRGLTLESFRDPDAYVAVGFWLNGVGMLLIGVMGIFGNIASMRVLSHKQMRSSANFILITLASSDLILIITSILLFGLPLIYPYNGHLKDYFFIIAPLLTKITFPLANIAQTISIYMTFLISFERYIAVCHPLKARSFCTHTRTKITILLIVLLAVIYNLTKFFETRLKEGFDEDYGKFYVVLASELRMNRQYIQIYIHWLYFIFMIFIPLAGITFFNLMILRQVRIVNRMRIKLTSKEQQDIKLTTMLFSVVIVFLICNFLSVLTNVLESFYNTHNDLLTKFSNFFVTINSSVNFIIYVVLVKKFRQIFIKQFASLFNCGEKNTKATKFTKHKTISSSDSDDPQTTNETL